MVRFGCTLDDIPLVEVFWYDLRLPLDEGHAVKNQSECYFLH
jgi:hypothetical protein